MTDPAGPPKLAHVEFTLEGEDFRMRSRVTVPAGPAFVGELLPVARALSDAVVRETSAAVEAAGAKISCRKGCGACCRNLVAISEVEARRVGAVVESLPEARRDVVRGRFAEARRRLERAGLLEELESPDRVTDEGYTALVGAYFEEGIPCPFLEEESCSIYDERPITCREFLVTSPPEHCASLGSEGVERVRLPVRVFNAVARWQAPPSEHFLERWVPLVLAPSWAAAHPDDPPAKPGPELLEDLLRNLGR